MGICTPFFTCEPMVRTVYNAGTDYCHYTIQRATGLQDDVATSSIDVYSSTCYAPDAYDEVDFNAQLRSMIDSQINHIKTLQRRAALNAGITQGTSFFNTYFFINDGGSDDTMYSIIYDTRGLTANETGARDRTTYGPGVPWAANTFPDPYIKQGQYISVMYRTPSNMRQTETCSFGCTYSYRADASSNVSSNASTLQSEDLLIDEPPTPPTPGTIVIANNTIDASITGQSFRYSGPADWNSWCENNNNILWLQFWTANSKGEKTYLSPKLYPKTCDAPETCYLYYVNSMGGIDFIRCKYERTVNTERSTYESNVDINQRFEFQEEVYAQRRWNTWTLHSSIVSDADSPNMADMCTARWAWIYDPNDTMVPWRSVSITDTSAKVKTKSNEGKLFIYDINVRENIKSKIV